MNVVVHIERLLLDGLPVDTASGPVLRAAVEAELSRLIAVDGLDAGGARGGVLAHLRGGEVVLPSLPEPGELGGQIGRAVHRGLTT